MPEAKTLLPPQLLGWLSKHNVIIELILVVLILTTYFTTSPGGILMVRILLVSMLTLASLYFVSALFISPVQELYGIIAMKVVPIASSVCVIGILFRLLGLSGALQMIMIGLLSIALGGLLLLLGWGKSQNKHYIPSLIRSLVLGTLTAWIFFSELSKPIP